MLRILREIALPAFVFFAVYWSAGAQTAQSPACSLDPPKFTASTVNIFNDQQEQYLGDAWAEYYEPRMHLAPVGEDDELTRIGERLLATLPPTGVQYRFRVYDSGDVNAFSLAGGWVYISRKMVAAVKNEDELAAVVAHEIGHIRMHQIAISFSRAFRTRLGVTQVTDGADIFARVHQLMMTPAKAYEKDDSDEDREVVADHVSMYALVRAGYAPESFAQFMNESMMNKGKTGDWLSDLLGMTRESSKRYRSVLKLIDELPAGCKERQPEKNDAFTAWQRGIVEERVKSVAAGIDNDQKLTLDTPLRPNLWHIRFSLDGHYVLGQDESGITVADKDAEKALFRIDAPGVEAAQFTTDSKSVVFHDSKLRIEQWSVPDGKRTLVKELVVYGGCNQTLLTPDGKTLVCGYGNIHGDYLRVGLRLIDVQSGTPFFEKDGFFEPGIYTPYAQRIWYALSNRTEADLMNMLTSPDGKYLLLVAGDKVLAYDLALRQPVGLGGKYKDLSQARMSFLGPDQLYAVFQAQGPNVYLARVMSFPDGQVVKETQIGNQEFDSVTKGPLLIVHPLKDFPVGLLDPIQGKVVTAAKLPAIDAWDTTIALEDAMGGLALAQIGTAGAKHIPLPLGPLPVPKAAAFSPDGKYLAVSMSDRAGIWNLETGKQVKLVRPFSSAWIDEKDELFGEFPKYVNMDPAELEIAIDPFVSTALGNPKENDVQYHDLQYSFKAIGGKPDPDRHGILLDQKTLALTILGRGRDLPPDRHATLEVKKMKTQAVAWARDYPDETPDCWPAEDNRLVLAWDLNSPGAKLEMTKFPALQKQADALKDKKKGLLIETVVPDTGSPVEEVVVPEVDLSHGWSDSRRAMVSGKLVLARGEDGVTAIYRMEDGARVGEFIGSTVATDAGSGVIAAVNREDEILLVDEHSGKELKRFTLGSPVRAARIVNAKEKALMVLTADQVVHRIPLPTPGQASARQP